MRPGYGTLSSQYEPPEYDNGPQVVRQAKANTLNKTATLASSAQSSSNSSSTVARSSVTATAGGDTVFDITDAKEQVDKDTAKLRGAIRLWDAASVSKHATTTVRSLVSFDDVS
jgi:cytoskeletal protein RodZ